MDCQQFYLGSQIPFVMVGVQVLASSCGPLLWVLWSSLLCLLPHLPAPILWSTCRASICGYPMGLESSHLGNVFLLASCPSVFLSVSLIHGNLTRSYQLTFQSPSYCGCSGQWPVLISPKEVRCQDLCPKTLEDKGSYFSTEFILNFGPSARILNRKSALLESIFSIFLSSLLEDPYLAWEERLKWDRRQCYLQQMHCEVFTWRTLSGSLIQSTGDKHCGASFITCNKFYLDVPVAFFLYILCQFKTYSLLFLILYCTSRRLLPVDSATWILLQLFSYLHPFGFG